MTRQTALSVARGRVWPWFTGLAVLLFCGECAAYGLWLAAGTALPDPAAWAVAAAVAMAGAAGGAFAVWRMLLAEQARLRQELADLRGRGARQQDLEQQLAGRAELQRRLRHDLRGALSPALLTADRLASHDDPKVRRAGEIMVASVDRASTLLDESVRE